jgi:hypothetical protein
VVGAGGVELVVVGGAATLGGADVVATGAGFEIGVWRFPPVRIGSPLDVAMYNDPRTTASSRNTETPTGVEPRRGRRA